MKTHRFTGERGDVTTSCSLDEVTQGVLYERPSSVFASFEDAQIAAVGAMLDEKMTAPSIRAQAGAS